MNDNTILVISNKVVHKNAKVDWPDMNYPDSGQTILRTLHEVDYVNCKIQLDNSDGPWFSAFAFNATSFPKGVGFYKKL
jgi:hypothetical protein